MLVNVVGKGKLNTFRKKINWFWYNKNTKDIIISIGNETERISVL